MAWLGLVAVHEPAQANFCKSVTTERARDEARLLESETFANPPAGESVDYVGDRAYNADIISCNRKRDNNGNDIEKRIKANHRFADNLEARSIKGKYNYYASAPLAYAYELRREKSIWIVRAPMRFHWPTARKTDMIDISMELVNQLGDPALSALCASGATVFDKNGKDVTRGYIPIRNTGAGIKGTDTVGVDEQACRVRRSTQVNSKSILRHLREFYANAITRVWNRPGFKIEPVLLDHGEGTEAQINAWDKDNITWELRLNLMPDHRASYKRWAFKWNNMYTGVPAHVIAHEFGHKLGFDDEYGWGPTVTRSQRDCANRRGTAPFEYIMCHQGASWDQVSGTDSDVHNGAKAVYAWLATRRYTIAEELQCKEDTDCGTGRFCAKGVLGVGRNQCEALKQNNEVCDRAAQCSSGRCAGGFCATQHECLADGDCGDGRFCKIGLGNLDRNTCRAKLADGQACAGDKQCASGTCAGWRPQDLQATGICYTANSKKAGEACKIDLECATGACNSNKRCVCKKDDDCSGSQWCDKGPDLHENSCRAKLDKGQACGKYGDLGVSRRCKSGKCSTKTGLGVPGVTTLYCK
ncbi:MAG: hypothetical protein M3436_20555 [Pseudomonadota bacterium]|nr:hypothetical protein [Pseudomonadota bacterium]